MPIRLMIPNRSFLPALCLAIIFTGILSGCEKDDICVDGDTPLLVVNFYDVEIPTEGKNVPSLRVVGLGQSDPVNTFSDRSNRDSVGLPLRSDVPQTGFVLFRNSGSAEDGTETGNPDTLYLNYTISEEFISRACGFVPNYGELEAELQGDAAPWIDSIAVVNPSVQSTLTTHVAIYH